MRADERRTIRAFAPAGLRQFNGKIFSHTRLIFEPQFFGIVGYAAISKARQRRKFWEKLAAQLDDLIAELDEFGGETFQRSLVDQPLFQDGVAGTQGARVTLEQRQVSGMRLAQEQVHKTPARA